MPRKIFVSIALLLLTLVSTAHAAGGAVEGTARGELRSGKKKVPLRFSYVVEKNALLRIILTSESLDEAALEDSKVLDGLFEEGAVQGLVIQLDEDRRAEEVFFHHPEIPAGLSVRELSKFSPKKSTDARLSGKVSFDDPGFSFSYQAEFDAPIVLQLQQIPAPPADASPKEHALWRLRILEVEPNEESFYDAVRSGETELVELLLQAGIPAESGGALADAVERGNPAIVTALIRAGADVNNRDAYGQSLVMRAASQGRHEIVKLLTDAGADPNVRNDYRIDPLAAAAEQGQVETVKVLLAAGANPLQRNTSGGTALSVAVLRGYGELVQILIDAGSDVARDQKSLLELAADKPEILKMIEEALKKKKGK